MIINILLPIVTFVLGGFVALLLQDTISRTINFLYEYYCKIKKDIHDVVWFVKRGHKFTREERQLIWKNRKNRKNIREMQKFIVDRLQGKTVKE